MLHFTLIARQSDALALSADTENSGGADLERNKVTAKNILRKLAANDRQGGGSGASQPPLLTVESQSYAYHILSDGGVLFLTMCDTSAPSALAFAYLEDVAREFLQQYGTQIATATRPYSFIKFDLYLQKTKKVFSSATSGRSAAALQRSGRPLPIKKSFREIMGHLDAQAPGGQGGSTSIAGNAKGGDNTLIFVGFGAAALFIVIVVVVLLV
jgi:vesicle transport protein SEC22